MAKTPKPTDDQAKGSKPADTAPTAEDTQDPAAAPASEAAQPQPPEATPQTPVVPPSAGAAKPKSTSDKVTDVLAGIVGFGIFALICYGAVRSVWGDSSTLELTAGVYSDATEEIRIKGQVSSGGKPVADARVWAQAVDRFGNPIKIQTTTSPENGSFTFDEAIGPPGQDIVLHAVKAGWLWKSERSPNVTVRTAQTAGTGSNEQTPTYNISGSAATVSLILLWFMASVVVALMISPKNPKRLRWQYHATVLMAFLFPIIVASAFVIGQNWLVTYGSENEVVSLGVATVFKGTYVENLQPEWVISLTLPPPLTPTDRPPDQSTSAPPVPPPPVPMPPDDAGSDLPPPTSGRDNPGGPATPPSIGSTTRRGPPTSISTADPKRPIKGFGAPLWVLFLSVIGAGLYTISLIVQEIKDPLDLEASESKPARRRIQVLVEHEFYVLFAPIGGAFVYQMLVLSNAAQEPVTVGLAAFGAGISVNAILSRAVTASQRAISASEEQRNGK